MNSEEEFQKFISNNPVAKITDASGNVTNITGEQAAQYGLTGKIPATTSVPIYKTDNGWSFNAYDSKMSISVDKDSGNIKIAAPKAITDTEEFKRVFNEDKLKEYSQAYKLNPDYKVTWLEKNEQTGEEEEKEVTVPEFVEKLNESLQNYADNLRITSEARGSLSKKYGNKAYNLTDSQMAMWMQKPSNSVYIPDTLFNISFFGDDPSKGNPFKKLIGKAGANGSYSLDDLKEIYTRDNFGRTELAGMVAAIDGALRGSEWSKEDYYEDENGNKIYNPNSANEAAKLLAFRDYVVSNHPDGEWYQQVGDNLETLLYNTSYYTTRVFMNVGNVAQGFFSGGSDDTIQNDIKSVDETMDYYNASSQMVTDAAQAMQFLGMIGGTLLGSYGVGVAAGAVGSAIGAVGSKIGDAMGVYTNLAEAAGLAEGSAAAEALSIRSMASIAGEAGNISKGAILFTKSLPVLEKAWMAKNVAKAYLDGHAGVNWAVSFLTDTLHDALLYDSTTLRDAIEASDDDTRDYWLGQLADNAKWWVGMGAAKNAVKFAGKTTIGKAADAVITPLVNKIAAKVGDTKQSFKDSIAGGSVVKKLEKKLEKAISDGNEKTANRIKRQLAQENWNTLTREARRALGDAKLDWDGVKLTEKSLEEFNNLKARVRALENGIDAYNRNISYKRQEMVGATYDPSTGRTMYINPTLAGANTKATDFYMKLSDLEGKYSLPVAHGSMISQDSIDYMMGKYYEGLASSFVKSGTENAAKAQEALTIIQDDLESLRKTLPREITEYIDRGIDGKVYQSWYASQNEYGISKGLLDKGKIESYDSNPIWQDNGYMPIVVQHEKLGYWVENTGKIDAVIEQDFNNLTFNVKPGQHYVDPELVRQSRLSNMAKAEVNSQMLKAYAGFGSNATNIERISGEETTYVRRIKDNRASLETAITKNSSAAFEENFNVELVIRKNKKLTKNRTVRKATRETVVSSMSPTQTTDFLVQKKVLPNSDAKLTDGITAENYEDWYKNLNTSAQKYLAQQYDSRGKIAKTGTFESLQKAMEEGGDDFEAGLQRAYLIGDEKFAKSSVMNEAARNLANGKDAFYQGVVVAKVKGELKNVPKVNINAFVDDLTSTIRGQIDDYVYMVSSNPGAKAAIDALAESSNGADEVARYVALNQLKSKNMENAYKAIDSQIDILEGVKDLPKREVDLLKEKAHELLKDTVRAELDDAAAVARTINPDLVDAKDIYSKARDLDREIRVAKENMKMDNSDVIMYLDDEGRQVYAQVDPAFASLFNYRFKMVKSEASRLAKINAATSKLFRYGTTSVNLASFGNQMFRDFGNAVLVGGSWQTIKSNADNLRDVFGGNIVEQIKRFDPSGYEMKQVREIAEQTGQTVEEAAVSRELARGAAISPTTTERTLYRDFMKQAYGDDTENMLTDVRNRFQEIVDKYNPEELLNGKRENYLRNRVYASNLNDAMKSGYSLEQARAYAEFAMNNATTNFSRQLYHMQAIADSTPYFRAAINGTKSFWRMWSLDPVGVTGRITGGLILPVMFLTGASLSTEENKKIYKNIPEYQKQDSLIFVFNGEVISAPIPQELSAIVAPFRQFVEYLNDSNENDFWELMANDVLGLSPYDLQGFSTIDMDKMVSDPTFFDRVNRGFSRLFSQSMGRSQ